MPSLDACSCSWPRSMLDWRADMLCGCCVDAVLFQFEYAPLLLNSSALPSPLPTSPLDTSRIIIIVGTQTWVATLIDAVLPIKQQKEAHACVLLTYNATCACQPLVCAGYDEMGQCMAGCECVMRVCWHEPSHGCGRNRALSTNVMFLALSVMCLHVIRYPQARSTRRMLSRTSC